MKNVVVINLTKTLNERNYSELCNTSLNKQYNPDTTGVSKHFEQRAVVAYAEICEGGGFGTEKTIALSGPVNGQKLQKLGLHSKTKCYAFKNILQ